MIKLGLSVGSPLARRRFCQRFKAEIPPSIQASEEPTVLVPVQYGGSGEFHNLAIIFTQRRSISAV